MYLSAADADAAPRRSGLAVLDLLAAHAADSAAAADVTGLTLDDVLITGCRQQGAGPTCVAIEVLGTPDRVHITRGLPRNGQLLVLPPTERGAARDNRAAARPRPSAGSAR